MSTRRGAVAKLSIAAASLTVIAVPIFTASSDAASSVPNATSPSFGLVWSQTMNGQNGNPNDTGNPIVISSPNETVLQGQPAVVVGDRAGYVTAYNLSTGTGIPGWPYNDGGVPIDASPSVAPAGDPSTVYIGLGNASRPTAGEYLSLNQSGKPNWYIVPTNPATDATRTAGVTASMTVGELEGQTAVTSGSLGQVQFAMNASNGAILPGWNPWFSGDTEVSTPAIADLFGTGQNEVIEGIGTSAGTLFGQPFSQGGHIRVITQNGNTGQQFPNGGQVCQLTTDEAVSSSPAVGAFLANSGIGIVSGTSDYYGGQGQPGAYTDAVVAMRPVLGGNCAQQWLTKLDGDTSDSPALADVLGNGSLQVVEGTSSPNTLSGSVYVLNGATGQVEWSRPAAGGVIGGITTADLSGDGYQDLIVPTVAGVQIFDGKSGAVIATLGQGDGFQSSPLITNDANGKIGITIAGYTYAGNQGVVEHYEVTVPGDPSVGASGAWPQFHHDAQLTGNASGNTPMGPSLPNVAPPSSPLALGMATTPDGKGYWLVGSDGGIFTFGDAGFYGSTGAMALNRPIVGMASSPDGKGYWLVASDGGIFTFGDAGYFGSTGAIRLNKPIVSMAATPDGKGYWLVASDGGIFSFGDAKFYGSTGSIALNRPIVGMASSPDGKGYWLVASDGGIFTFGDAGFLGSTGGRVLNKPIVSMAATPDGKGYWLVASDGGIFTFGDAGFYGSTGSIALNKPIVGMASAPDGHGYWLEGSDGGIFTFGDAGFFGSRSGQPL
jgi:hypothetical protein